MNRFSLSAFLNALVTTFVTLTLLVASTDEGFHIFSHTGVHSEHHHSEKQGSTTTQTISKGKERERPSSRAPRNTTQDHSITLNTDASLIPFNSIACLSSVILRI